MGSAIQGVSAIWAGNEERKAANEQAAIVESEANQQAQAKQDEVKKFRAQQEMSFLKSGVLLDGSPLLVMNETTDTGLAEANSIREAGRAKANYLYKQGRNAFIGGWLKGGAHFADGASKAASGGAGG